MTREPHRSLRDRLSRLSIDPAVEARIVRGVLARAPHAGPTPRGRAAGWIAIGVLATGAAAGVALWSRGPRTDVAPADEVALAPARTASPHDAPAPAVAQTLSAPTTGPLEAEIDRHRVVLAAGARIERLASPPGVVRTRVARGGAQFQVAKLARAEGFRVDAEPIAVEVVGTAFEVKRVGACSHVRVDEGEVKVIFGAAVVARLAAGAEQAFCRSPAGLETSAPGEALVRRALALISEGARLGDAAALLDRYRREHPAGVFDGESLFHLALLRARLGDAAAADRHARAFVGRYAGDPRVGKLRPLLRKAPGAGDPPPGAADMNGAH